MGHILAYILAVIFALVAVMVLVIIIISDVRQTREYLNAYRVLATIDEYKGVKKTSNYGLTQPGTKYQQYAVSFTVRGQQCSGIHLCKEKGLSVGDQIEVRYVRTEDNEIKVVNRDIKDRFFRMLICTAIAVSLCIIYIVFFR